MSEKPGAIAMTLSTAKWTIDHYHRMIETGILDDRQVELLNGVIVEMVPEGTAHTYFSDRFANQLRVALSTRAQIREARPITLPNNSEPEPDIAVVQLLNDVYLQHHPYPENIFWLIEYSDSSLTKDLEEKSKIYAAAGIPEYWVVNLRDRLLIVEILFNLEPLNPWLFPILPSMFLN
ncbi:Uma2 family endonuclease [Microcoleus sp. PH2017_40_RAT_O_B]|uniref:Uma2 family endonuclease n=1 Tax=Microcoleus sp. PH2017_40_RAT_O_B TaxID=2798850 RepID=UPI00344EEBA6